MPLHPRLHPAEVSQILSRTGSRLLVHDGVHKLPSSALGLQLPQPSQNLTVPRLVGPARAVNADWLVLTSGTAGRPKIARLSDEAFHANADAARRRLGLDDGDRWLFSLSLAHAGGLAMLLRGRDIGQSLVFPSEGGQPPASFEYTSWVPTQLHRWLQDNPTPAAHQVRGILVGGAPVPEDLERQAREAGLPIRITYGLTETHSQAATQTVESPAGSAGPSLDGVEIAERGGELWIRGPTLFQGYLDDPKATERTLQGGWLHTGDSGSVDKNGNVWVRGRLDDLVISGGENVDPLEVERVIMQAPGVLEACVVGVPDEAWGQRVVALVVPRPGTTVDGERLKGFCRALLAPFKVPKEFRFVTALERTSTGKVSRQRTRAKYG